jgi:hypothetical protein
MAFLAAVPLMACLCVADASGAADLLQGMLPPEEIRIAASSSYKRFRVAGLLSDDAACAWQSDGEGTFNHELTIKIVGGSSANGISVCDQNNSGELSPETVGVRVTLADGREVTSRVRLTSHAERVFTTLYDDAAFTKCVVSMAQADRTHGGANVQLHGLRVWRRRSECAAQR